MPNFRKKPVVIEAVQWTGKESLDAIKKLSGEAFFCWHFNHDTIRIKTLEGFIVASLNDWIIKGVQGEFYPCKPDIFEATYELVQ